MAASEPFDYAGMADFSDDLIQAAGMPAKLQRAGIRRDCNVVVVKYNPRDAQTQLANPTQRKVIIARSFEGVEIVAPDFEKDVLVTFVQPDGVIEDERLSFNEPVELIKPAGLLVCYFGTVRK